MSAQIISYFRNKKCDNDFQSNISHLVVLNSHTANFNKLTFFNHRGKCDHDRYALLTSYMYIVTFNIFVNSRTNSINNNTK